MYNQGPHTIVLKHLTSLPTTLLFPVKTKRQMEISCPIVFLKKEVNVDTNILIRDKSYFVKQTP